MRLGTRLTLYLSLIIMVALSGYGYINVLSRRDILIRKMQVEVRSMARTLRVALEKISLPREMEYVQDLIDAVSEDERTLGVIVYHRGKNLVFHSPTVAEEIKPCLEAIKRSMKEDLAQEEFVTYRKTSVFMHAFPLKDKKGNNIGGVSILQHTSFMEEDIRKAKWFIFIVIFILIGGTVAMVLFGTRRWISLPISQLVGGIKRMSKGELDTRIALKSGDELSDLAQAFNQMAADLKTAQDRIIREAENRLELERNLRQSEKLATIGQLASGLAHEIGTPLNIISGRAELTREKLEENDGIRKNLDVILHQTGRITKIIQQLLGFVRKKKPEQVPLQIPTLLDQTLDFLDPQIHKQQIEVLKNYGDDLPAVVGDPDQLQQVFMNLIVNAIQSMPDGGGLRISISPRLLQKEGTGSGPRRYVEVRMEDTGAGMGKEVIQNIFNPFFTTKDTGTGLGLMVSQGIVIDHEGWIDVESEIGKGSVFKVNLPAFQGGQDESEGLQRFGGG